MREENGRPVRNPRKRILLRAFDELLPEDQNFTLDFVKLLKKNSDKKASTTGNSAPS